MPVIAAEQEQCMFRTTMVFSFWAPAPHGGRRRSRDLLVEILRITHASGRRRVTEELSEPLQVGPHSVHLPPRAAASGVWREGLSGVPVGPWAADLEEEVGVAGRPGGRRQPPMVGTTIVGEPKPERGMENPTD